MKKKLNVRRLVKFIFTILYVAFAVISMFHHNITTIAELGTELEMYSLVYAVMYIIIDKFKFSEVKELFIEK